MERALALGPEHLSLYSLIVEEGTPLFSWVRDGRVIPADDDTAADMYEYAMERLADAGYGQYEISNWALPGHECRHNLTYWRNLPYIGLGAGAHSCFAGHRFAEARPIAGYIARVRAAVDASEAREAGEEVTALPAGAIVEDEVVSPRWRWRKRRCWGCGSTLASRARSSPRAMAAPFEQVFDERLADMRDLGLIETVGDRIRLTEHGRLLGNEVFARLLPDEPAAIAN